MLDDLSTGRRENVAAGAGFVQADIRDHDAVAAAVSKVDRVIHLAAIASVMRYSTDWSGASSVNLGGSLTVMRACAEHGLPFVYASSAAVYGAADSLPLSEAAPAWPISGYGADKLAGELHARAMAETDGLGAVGLRFFNVYGPRQMRGSAYSGVITNFLDRWQAGEALTVFGDGSQSRDFICVDDIVRATLAASDLAAGGKTHVFNICTGRPITVRDLIGRLSDATGHRFSVDHAAPRAGEILHSLGDPSLARDRLGFEAKTDMSEGLAGLVAWFRDNPG